MTPNRAQSNQASSQEHRNMGRAMLLLKTPILDPSLSTRRLFLMSMHVQLHNLQNSFWPSAKVATCLGQFKWEMIKAVPITQTILLPNQTTSLDLFSPVMTFQMAVDQLQHALLDPCTRDCGYSCFQQSLESLQSGMGSILHWAHKSGSESCDVTPLPQGGMAGHLSCPRQLAYCTFSWFALAVFAAPAYHHAICYGFRITELQQLPS